jgi:putative metallohydrolase (TIGR04338 family)
MSRDTQRGKVYAAEQFVRTLFDRAAEHGSGAVDFFGTALTLPPEARFGSVESVRQYVDSVLSHPAVRRQWPGGESVSVRPRRGVTAAHYEIRKGSAVIAVPARDRWALRELVVLHEIAHHLCAATPPHGPEFVSTYAALAGLVMGPEVEHVLRVVYLKEGVAL